MISTFFSARSDAAAVSDLSPFRQPKTEPDANSIHFLDEDLALVPASGIPGRIS